MSPRGIRSPPSVPLGERILAGVPALERVAVTVRSSHERWDGNGYPDGLAGEEIPIGARIIGAAMPTAR